MLSIGWVMFWKAVVLGLYAVARDTWAALKRKNIENGLRLKQNRHGVYVPDDRLQNIERWTRRIVKTGAVLVGAYAVFVFAVFFSSN